MRKTKRLFRFVEITSGFAVYPGYTAGLPDFFYLHGTMPGTVEGKKVFSLLEVMESVRRTLSERYGSPFWVKAEMSKLNHYTHSGHCYPELLEKKEGKVVAQIKANLWKEDYIRINETFLRVLKEPLKNGIMILFSARITFDPVHGLALRILEIDPVFSLGELEREKQETIDRLHKEGIIGRNKALHLALVPQRIAVISVETSKGFADFRKVVDENSWNYRFFYMLFPSLLQGEKVAESIGRQLERIRLVRSHFDAVAIIRGGGGDIGLSGYNQYELARHVALFPLPVITGICHATNETVTEMVAFRNCITPTDLAGFLIQQFHNFSVPVREAQQALAAGCRQRLSVAGQLLAGKVPVLGKAVARFIHLRGLEILHLEKQRDLLDPKRILARGFTITLHINKPVYKSTDVQPGDVLKTLTAEGSILSKVTRTQNNPNE